MKKPTLHNLAMLNEAGLKGAEQQAERTTKSMFRTSVYLTQDLKRSLKLRMLEEDRDMSAIIREALDRYLNAGSGITR